MVPLFFMRIMKDFYTYEQQIEKLKKDGLIIDNENYAKEELKFEGYYNIINGYSPLFKKDNVFLKGINFENINALYDFDKTIRSIVYKYASLIECHIKALIAHEFSKVHGVDEKKYLNFQSFTQNKNDKGNVERLINDCKKTIENSLNKDSKKYRIYINHNLEKHGHVPMWVLIRAISFGTTSIFYSCMLESEKESIAKIYNLNSNQLANILEMVVCFRNIVAHGERTFCAKIPKKRLTTNLVIAKKLNIKKNEKGYNRFGRNDFLSLLICFKYLLSQIEFASFFNELEIAFEIIEKRQPPYIMDKIKFNMGLKFSSWKRLPLMQIKENK